MYNLCEIEFSAMMYVCMCVCAVDGGHRAVLFSRLTGIQNKIYPEGIHFRYSHLL